MSTTKRMLKPHRGARPSYRRATFYLTESLIKRVKIRAIEDGTDASATVRTALEAYLGPEKGARS